MGRLPHEACGEEGRGGKTRASLGEQMDRRGLFDLELVEDASALSGASQRDPEVPAFLIGSVGSRAFGEVAADGARRAEQLIGEVSETAARELDANGARDAVERDGVLVGEQAVV